MRNKSRRTIIVTKNIAFCSGVKRAVSLAENETRERGETYTVDAILHNEEEVKRLESLGVKRVREGETGKTVILPAHGSTSLEILSLSKRFGKVIDTTCPLVLRTAKIIEKMRKEGYKIAIVGDEHHRETIVLKDKAGEFLYGVFKDGKDAINSPSTPKIAIVAQSTSTEEKLFAVAEALILKTQELRFFNTICEETLRRQEEAREISKKVDCMIVIGGKTSANSQRLFEIVKAVNPKTYFVHCEKDVKIINLSTCDSVGITSGTSTPLWLIEKIINILSE